MLLITKTLYNKMCTSLHKLTVTCKMRNVDWKVFSKSRNLAILLVFCPRNDPTVATRESNFLFSVVEHKRNTVWLWSYAKLLTSKPATYDRWRVTTCEMHETLWPNRDTHKWLYHVRRAFLFPSSPRAWDYETGHCSGAHERSKTADFN